MMTTSWLPRLPFLNSSATHPRNTAVSTLPYLRDPQPLHLTTASEQKLSAQLPKNKLVKHRKITIEAPLDTLPSAKTLAAFRAQLGRADSLRFFAQQSEGALHSPAKTPPLHNRRGREGAIFAKKSGNSDLLQVEIRSKRATDPLSIKGMKTLLEHVLALSGANRVSVQFHGIQEHAQPFSMEFVKKDNHTLDVAPKAERFHEWELLSTPTFDGHEEPH